MTQTLQAQHRALKLDVKERYKNYKVGTDSMLLPWLVRHSAWLLGRFLPRGSHGHASYQRLRGEACTRGIVQFAETVLFHDPSPIDKKHKLDSR